MLNFPRTPLTPLTPLAIAAILAFAGCTVDATEGITDDASLERHCEQAAASLRQCGAEVPEDFLQACNHDPSPESIELVEGLAEAECDEEVGEGKADGWGARAFGAACTPVMYSGALTNRWRNGQGGPIPRDEREALRPMFGSLVDDITVHYDASITTRWTVGGRTVEYGSFTGQAFGNDVYIRAPYRPGDESQLVLLAHEIQHSQQGVDAGGLRPQLTQYCREFYNAGFSYQDHPLEEEARDVAREFRRCFRRGECQ